MNIHLLSEFQRSASFRLVQIAVPLAFILMATILMASCASVENPESAQDSKQATENKPKSSENNKKEIMESQTATAVHTQAPTPAKQPTKEAVSTRAPSPEKRSTREAVSTRERSAAPTPVKNPTKVSRTKGVQRSHPVARPTVASKAGTAVVEKLKESLNITVTPTPDISPTEEPTPTVVESSTKTIGNPTSTLDPLPTSTVEPTPTDPPVTPTPKPTVVPEPIPTPEVISRTTTIKGSVFSESEISVKKGTKVIWENLDAWGHTVTSTDGIFDSKTISGNMTFERVFSEPGTFGFLCVIHPSMTGQITVQE